MNKFIERIESVYKTILRGCKTYEDFLNLLKDLNAPTNKDEFFVFFVDKLYVDDDFFALIALIEQNKEAFDSLATNEILKKICTEIFEDYLNF